MKKLLTLILALALLFTVASCSTAGGDPAGLDKTSDGNLEGSLDDILGKIYETAELDDNFRSYIEEGLMKTEITPENCENYFGTTIEFESGLASEPTMQPSAYLLNLIRVKEGADIEKIKTDIKENADPMRWICVGVDPSNIYVENVGDVVMLVMSDNAGEALSKAFLALK
jgi:predicted small secreted protein